MDFEQATIEVNYEPVAEDIFLNRTNDYEKISNRKMYITHSLPGTQAQDGNNVPGVFAIIPVKCVITGIWLTAESPSSAGTPYVYVKKLIAGENKAGGVSVQTGNFSLAPGVASDLVQTGVLTTVLADKQLIKGDRLSIQRSGTLTNVIGLNITVELTI